MLYFFYSCIYCIYLYVNQLTTVVGPYVPTVNITWFLRNSCMSFPAVLLRSMKRRISNLPTSHFGGLLEEY